MCQRFWISGKSEVSRKKKSTAADLKRRLIDDDRDISPFASIKLVEKKEEIKRAKPQVKPERKKPSEIVQGYDPSSSFADILYSYEHTGNPYSMPSPSKGKIKAGSMDFGAILDKWEGKSSQKPKARPAKETAKSTYTPSRSFADILDSFEGKKPKAAVDERESAEAKATVPSDVDKPLSESLFRKAEDGESVASSASWSIFGGRNEGFVRPEPATEEPKGTASRPRDVKKAKYHPTKSFSDILNSYEGKGVVQKSEILPERREEKKEPILSESLFRTPDKDERTSDNVSWSVFGGRNENFVRPEAERTGEKVAQPAETKASHYAPSSSFGDILEKYAREPEKVKTFDEYLKEKGDDEKRKETLTLSRLRTMPPQSTLDLHGYTAKEAENAVRSFLSECHDNGIRKISIITGKGLHSEDGVGVLKSTVQAVLDESGLVSEKASAPLSAGGSGALWIILKA